jgi:hypothetical protein
MRDLNFRDEQFEEAMSEIASTLQAAGLLVTLQRRQAGEMTRDAIKLELALERATSALRRLQPHLVQRIRS